MNVSLKEECYSTDPILAVIAAGGDDELDRLMKENPLKAPLRRTDFLSFYAIRDAHRSGFIGPAAAKAAMLQYCNFEELRDLAINALMDMRAWDVAEALVLDQSGKWNAASERALTRFLKMMDEASKKAGQQKQVDQAARLLKVVRQRSPEAVADVEEFWDEWRKEMVE